MPPRMLTDEETARLQASLKRCSPATFDSACAFLRTGDRAHLPPLIRGILERYVERSLRPRLATPSDDLRLNEDLGLDSLTMMEVVILAEDVLGISIANDELARLRTLGDIHAFIDTKIRAAPQ